MSGPHSWSNGCCSCGSSGIHPSHHGVSQERQRFRRVRNQQISGESASLLCPGNPSVRGLWLQLCVTPFSAILIQLIWGEGLCTWVFKMLSPRILVSSQDWDPFTGWGKTQTSHWGQVSYACKMGQGGVLAHILWAQLSSRLTKEKGLILNRFWSPVDKTSWKKANLFPVEAQPIYAGNQQVIVNSPIIF